MNKDMIEEEFDIEDFDDNDDLDIEEAEEIAIEEQDFDEEDDDASYIEDDGEAYGVDAYIEDDASCGVDAYNKKRSGNEGRWDRSEKRWNVEPKGVKCYDKVRDTMQAYGFPRGKDSYEVSGNISNEDVKRSRTHYQNLSLGK